jgi:hypothetical protein
VVSPYWEPETDVSSIGLAFGVGARMASNELVVLGPLFAQITLGYVDAEILDAVKIAPLVLRAGPLFARAPSLGEYRFGGEVSAHTRIEPPGRWSIDLGVGAYALAHDSTPFGISLTGGIGAEL